MTTTPITRATASAGEAEAEPITKATLLARYEQILARGCLDASQRRRVLRGEPVEGIVIQQSGGSSGSTPLQLPRTRAEMNWLGGTLLSRYFRHHGRLPQRVAFVGGISHMAATHRARIDLPMEVESFTGGELMALDAFDPQVISMYPSFARTLVADPRLRLASLDAVKLGGEPLLPSDLLGLRRRFGAIVVVEQLGSTEMPAVALRTHGPGPDTGYQLSTDRYDFAFQEHDGWQPLVVRDRFPDRAFPLDGWYDTGDEVQVVGGSIGVLRRRGDPSFVLRGELDALLADGCVNVQILPREAQLLCSPGSSPPGPSVTLGGRTLAVRIEPPYRLVDSNKLPLWLDTRAVAPSRRYRSMA